MALYYSKGRISEMSEVQSGQSRSGNTWQRMTLTLEIPGFQGSVTKQVFQVFGESVDDVLEFHVGDKVEIGFALYAREFKGRYYNNVDLVNITLQEGASHETAQVKDYESDKMELPLADDTDIPF